MLVNAAYPIGAAPSGRPGWPEFAFWIASAERTLMALTVSCFTSCIITSIKITAVKVAVKIFPQDKSRI